MLQRFSNLKKIQVCNFKGDIDEAVLAIARSGLDLEELVALSYCRSYPEFWLEELGTNMKNLKVLKFTGGDGDADFVRVVDAFLQLEELQIEDEAPHYNSVTDEGRDYMSSKLKRLRKIDLSNKSRISDKCPRLCHFVMTGSCLGKEEYNYDGLMEENRAIKYLDISSHDEFRPTALKRLLSICPELEKLKLHSCVFLPDDQLNVPDILECNRSLGELNLTGSHHITVKDTELESSVLEKLIVKI
uniref:Uncharacterized protein n=1 Tax=Chenopodium quinoa TaxID=63459 RepID=A0A803LE79_CHEQI